MRPDYFKQIFPATEIKRQTPCGARDEGARKLTLCFRGVSNRRSHSEMHSSSRYPAPHVFSLSPPSPPGPPQSLLGTTAATYPSAPALQAVQLPEGATSNPSLRCGVAPGPPPALLHTHTRGARRAGQPPARLRDGVPRQAAAALPSKERSATAAGPWADASPPRPDGPAVARPSRRPGGPRYGVAQQGSRRGNARPREAPGRAWNGADRRAALEAPAPRISFSPQTHSAMGASRRREAGGEVKV